MLERGLLVRWRAFAFEDPRLAFEQVRRRVSGFSIEMGIWGAVLAEERAKGGLRRNALEDPRAGV